jgi:hypothetical protein
VQSVFNYPTLGDIYKHAADDGLSRIARRRRQTDLVLSEAAGFEAEIKERIRRKEEIAHDGGHHVNGNMARAEAGAVQADAPKVRGDE